jgi:hypothetical protein
MSAANVASQGDMPGDFVHRTVSAATAPRLEGLRPASPFLLAPQVEFAAADTVVEPQLEANFYRAGSVRFAFGQAEVFLTQREALVLGSRLVAHAVASEEGA